MTLIPEDGLFKEQLSPVRIPFPRVVQACVLSLLAHKTSLVTISTCTVATISREMFSGMSGFSQSPHSFGLRLRIKMS